MRRQGGYVAALLFIALVGGCLAQSFNIALEAVSILGTTKVTRPLTVGTCYRNFYESLSERQTNCTLVRSCMLAAAEKDIFACAYIIPSANVLNGSVMPNLSGNVLSMRHYYNNDVCSEAPTSSIPVLPVLLRRLGRRNHVLTLKRSFSRLVWELLCQFRTNRLRRLLPIPRDLPSTLQALSRTI
jgi:hypothetical protein